MAGCRTSARMRASPASTAWCLMSPRTPTPTARPSSFPSWWWPLRAPTRRVTDAGNACLADALTDGDGRVPDLGPDEVKPGVYRLVFDVATYANATGQTFFFPEVVVTFTVSDPSRHHVPLLLSPFAYSTYRGS